MKNINIFKYLNPFRLVALPFLAIGYLFEYLADFFDNLGARVTRVIFKSENLKNATPTPMNNKLGKFLIGILLICLILIWADWFGRIS